MGIVVTSDFTMNSALPLDDRTQVANTTARDAISSGRRWQGMIVYVIADETNYQLVGGITNGDWVELSGGGGGGALVVSATQTLDDADPIVLTADAQRERVKIQSSGGEVIVTIPNGTIDGQELKVQGMSNTNYCIIEPSANVSQNGNVYFYLGIISTYIWDSTLGMWMQERLA